MQDLKVLGFQSDLIWQDPPKNRQHFQEKILNHFDNHHLIMLPENFTTGFPDFPSFTSEKIDGDSVMWMAEMAQNMKAVITGSLIIETNGHYYNTLLWMLPSGKYEVYRKRHVFSLAGENEVISKGRKELIVELNGWKIKPMICYDLRFPVWSKNRLDEDGKYNYDLALYIANWPAVRSYPWKQLLIARAIENLSYVFGLNRVGHDGAGIFYSGDSMVIDPKGITINKPIAENESVISTTLSHEKITSFREKFNVGLDWDSFSLEIE